MSSILMNSRNIDHTAQYFGGCLKNNVGETHRNYIEF